MNAYELLERVRFRELAQRLYRVRITGAGVRAVAKRTNKMGQVVFTVKPRKRGKLVFSATKAGYQPAYRSMSVR